MEAKEFGGYLKELRKKRKLTIRQLDAYSGVSHSYISQMERGERGVPSPDILKKLAKPLGVNHDELMKMAGHLEKKDEDLSNVMSFKGFKDDMLFMIRNTEDPVEKEKLINELREWGELTGLDEFFNEIELSDESLLKKYNFTYRGKPVDEEKVKKILSYIRFVASEED